ncbi:MAG: MBOAT family protein [Eubacteriales bacterium]|nr:MBOAT family protein [Eubacteriales bacterium]
MLFSDLVFLFFFLPLFFLCTFIFKNSIPAKNMIILAFSFVFYAWGEPVYILLLILSIAVNYAAGLLLDMAGNKSRRKAVLVGAVIFNLALLGFFKYIGFIIENINVISGLALPVPEIELPIGISFYTFQIMSYVIDMYRSEVKVQENPLYLGAYLVAFPQLIAGPIVRYQTIAEELEERSVSTEDFAYGMRRFIIGLSKKVLIANQAAVVADGLLSGGIEITSFGAAGAWLAMIAYSVQIYYDFNGYSDMAIGMGRAMGFHYLENFKNPYQADSASDFWRRWHISLSTFFRDYVYIPMGGNRVPVHRWIFNMLTVWLLTGLWHGASWNFILWGLYFGVILIAEKFLLKYRPKIKALNHITALFIIIIGWTIFRCESLSLISDTLLTMLGASGLIDLKSLYASGTLNLLYITAIICGIAGCVPAIRTTLPSKLRARPGGATALDIGLIMALLLSIAVLARGSYNPFIYFRF